MTVSQLWPISSPAGLESFGIHGSSNVNVLWMAQAPMNLRAVKQELGISYSVSLF